MLVHELEEEEEKCKEELEKEKEKLEKEKEKLEKEREKFEQEMEQEKEHLEWIMTAKDETITVLKEKFDSVKALKDFNWKHSTIQKWGKSTPVFCF